jgi:hypothetical protein
MLVTLVAAALAVTQVGNDSRPKNALAQLAGREFKAWSMTRHYEFRPRSQSAEVAPLPRHVEQTARQSPERLVVVFASKAQPKLPFTSAQLFLAPNGCLGDVFGRDVDRVTLKKFVAGSGEKLVKMTITADAGVTASTLQTLIRDISEALPDDSAAVIYVVAMR